MYVFFNYFFSTVHTVMPGGVTANHLVLDYKQMQQKYNVCCVVW